MCGLFGFAGSDFSPRVMQKIAEHTEAARGGHAFGFAWRTRAGRIRCFKAPGEITPDAFDVCEGDVSLLIGHLRYATHGEPCENINNHPHPSDAGWIVHNGVIGNHRQIADTFGLYRNTDCDSEVFGQLIEVIAGPLERRIARAVKLCSTSNFAMLGLWGRKLIAARAGNPLHYVNAGKATYIASLAQSLPGHAIALADNTQRRFEYRLAVPQ